MIGDTVIYSFVGTNRYAALAALREQQAIFVAEYGDFSVEKIDVSEWEISRVLDTCSALPFLSKRRLLIVEGLSQNKVAAEDIEKIIAAISDETDVYISEIKLDKRSVLYKVLKKNTNYTEFVEIDQRAAPKWVAEEVKKRGGNILLNDALFLVARCGASQELLSHEIDKLLLYDMSITRKTIELLTEPAVQSSVFELIEAAFRGDSATAERLYDEQRVQNVEPLAMEALFVWQLHILLLLKAAGQSSPEQVAAETGISPYVAKKSASLARLRTMSELKMYVQKLAELEYALKSVSINPDEAIKNYITHLAVA